MSKIYSRPRIRIPKVFLANVKDKKYIKKKKISKIFIIMVIAFSTVKLVLDAILPGGDNTFVTVLIFTFRLSSE